LKKSNSSTVIASSSSLPAKISSSLCSTSLGSEAVLKRHTFFFGELSSGDCFSLLDLFKEDFFSVAGDFWSGVFRGDFSSEDFAGDFFSEVFAGDFFSEVFARDFFSEVFDGDLLLTFFLEISEI